MDALRVVLSLVANAEQGRPVLDEALNLRGAALGVEIHL
jgi:hypothetical protein